MGESHLTRTCGEPDRYTSVRLDRDDRPSDAVVRAVATLTDRDPLDLDPLATVVDPDALDRLFPGTWSPAPGAPDGDADSSKGPVCRFTYAGCVVCVSPGVVRVRRVEET